VRYEKDDNTTETRKEIERVKDKKYTVVLWLLPWE
jgi:hypothetical protein